MANNQPLTKLPLQCQIDNAIMACAALITWTATVQWTINTWRAEYRTWKRNGSKGVFMPTMPRRMKVFNYLAGESCAMIRHRLVEYGISVQLQSLRFDLWPDGGGVGLHCSFLVPGPQAYMADVILRQHAAAYAVTSASVRRKKSDSAAYAANNPTPWRPWGVPAKPRSWDEAVTEALWSWIMGRATMVKRGKGKRNQTVAEVKKARSHR